MPVIVASFSRFAPAAMLPRNHIRDSLVGMWLLLSEQLGAVSAVVPATPAETT